MGAEAETCCVCLVRSTSLKRCSVCKSRWYCSVTCQRRDWKVGQHKRACRPTAAWRELAEIVGTCSVEAAHQDFQKASDEIQRLKKEEKINTSKHIRKTRFSQYNVKESKSGVDVSDVQTALDLEERQSSFWKYAAEYMPNLSYYLVQFHPMEHPATGTRVEPEDLTIDFDTSDTDNKTSVQFRVQEEQLRLKFAGEFIQSPETIRVSQSHDGTLSVRLPVVSGSVDEMSPLGIATSKLISAEDASSISCAHCKSSLLQSRSIERVLPLPSGHWNDLTDYLMCYPGQPVADFTNVSTTAQPSTVLEDETILVFHADDIGQRACVLAVTGYGEGHVNDQVHNDEPDDSAVVRGPRSWRDSVGGASLTCSFCGGLLGFASTELPDTFRFLKHFVGTRSMSPVLPTLSFLTHEMIRYAETKAIFMFRICIESDDRALLLQLLSWNSILAAPFSVLSSNRGSKGVTWNKVAKIIFEETSERSSASGELWTWTNDWCCTDANKEEKTKGSTQTSSTASVVKIYLSEGDWENLRWSLKDSSSIYTREIVDAAVLMKTGVARRSDHNSGLAVVPIS